jgi:hypothetical protein
MFSNFLFVNEFVVAYLDSQAEWLIRKRFPPTAFSIKACSLQVREVHCPVSARMTLIAGLGLRGFIKCSRQIANHATDQKQRGGVVGVREILTQIDREIAQLKHARVLLAGKTAPAKKKKKAKPAPALKKAVKKKRNLSPEGRRRIAEAVKKRWAEQKKVSTES